MSHEAYQELCALAAIGQLSAAELSLLQAHMDVCDECRDDYVEYQEMVQNLGLAPPPKSDAFSIDFSPEPDMTYKPRKHDYDHEGARRRFIEEAKRRGFRFSKEIERGPDHSSFLKWLTQGWGSNHKLLTIFAVLTTLLICGLYWSDTHRTALANEVAELRSQNTALRGQVSQLTPSTATKSAEQKAGHQAVMNAPNPAGTASEDAASRAALEAELARLRQESSTLQTRAAAAEAQVKIAETQVNTVEAQAKTFETQARAAQAQVQERLLALSSQSETLRAELDASRTAERQLTGKLQEAERAVQEMSVEVRSLREKQQQDARVIAAQNTQLENWGYQLRDQTDQLGRQKGLLDADRDIRDIMTARNLHVIDVRDVDSKGRTRQPVGRIFYTENRSLVFYAFDLTDKRVLNADYAFQAWGYRESNDHTARSLGIFYVDDQKQKRWALKFDDPRILQQIDAVFVTIEPPGGSKKPTGEKLLYAYLKNKPNHP